MFVTNTKYIFRGFMVHTVNVIISPVTDLVVHYVVVMVYVIVVHASVIKNGQVHHVIVTQQMKRVLWMEVPKYAQVVVTVNVVSVSVLKKMVLDILENTAKNVQ